MKILECKYISREKGLKHATTLTYYRLHLIHTVKYSRYNLVNRKIEDMKQTDQIIANSLNASSNFKTTFYDCRGGN